MGIRHDMREVTRYNRNLGHYKAITGILPKYRVNAAQMFRFMLEENYMRPRSLSRKKLARFMQININLLNSIMEGRILVNNEISLCFSIIFETNQEFWINTQKKIYSMQEYNNTRASCDIDMLLLNNKKINKAMEKHQRATLEEQED